MTHPIREGVRAGDGPLARWRMKNGGCPDGGWRMADGEWRKQYLTRVFGVN
jgi:hypothetical protein